MFQTVYVEKLDIRVNASVEEDEIWIVPCTRTYTEARDLMKRLVDANYDAETDIYLWALSQEEIERSAAANEDVYEATISDNGTYYDFIVVVDSSDSRYLPLLNSLEDVEQRHIS